MKNTEYNIQAVDLIALTQTFDQMKIKWRILKTINHLKFTIERYAMDQNGGYVGYEKYSGILLIIHKTNLGITGIPHHIFPNVVIPDMLILNSNVGAKRETKNYYKADDDFAFQELQYKLKEAIKLLPDAEFDSEKRKWECGYFEQYLD